MAFGSTAFLPAASGAGSGLLGAAGPVGMGVAAFNTFRNIRQPPRINGVEVPGLGDAIHAGRGQGLTYAQAVQNAMQGQLLGAGAPNSSPAAPQVSLPQPGATPNPYLASAFPGTQGSPIGSIGQNAPPYDLNDGLGAIGRGITNTISDWLTSRIPGGPPVPPPSTQQPESTESAIPEVDYSDPNWLMKNWKRLAGAGALGMDIAGAWLMHRDRQRAYEAANQAQEEFQRQALEREEAERQRRAAAMQFLMPSIMRDMNIRDQGLIGQLAHPPLGEVTGRAPLKI